jgi:hypothetical protein
MMRLILTTIILTMLAQPVWAFKAGDLYKYCKSWQQLNYSLDISTVEAALCIGHIFAWHGALTTACLRGYPDLGASITEEQLAQAFLNFADKRPEVWEYNAVSIGYHFLGAFPCKE